MILPRIGKMAKVMPHIQGNSNHTRPGARVEKTWVPGIWQDREQLVQDIDYTYTILYQTLGGNEEFGSQKQGSGPNQSTGCAHINLEIMGSQVFLSAIHGHTVWIEILSTRDISANGS